MQLQDKFYKSTEVSDILGVSLRTLYRYMETGKIQSVHLPSGRHRFTKDQIEQFLFASKYMTFDTSEEKPKTLNVDNTVNNINTSNTDSFSTTQYDRQSQTVVPNPTPFTTPVPAPVEQETTDIDNELEQLLKSLEEEAPAAPAAPVAEAPKTEIHRTEEVITQSFTPVEENKEDDLDAFLKSLETEESEQKPQSSFTSILNDNYGLQSRQTTNENEIKYYYCPFNDLKSIAKMIKKIGDNNDKQYAFTMNAGLSLFFPLDLFSMIHFYVNVHDLPYFEKELELKPSNKTEANLAILLTDGDAFMSIKEVSGFKVVRKEKIIENLKANGLGQLAGEAELRL